MKYRGQKLFSTKQQSYDTSAVFASITTSVTLCVTGFICISPKLSGTASGLPSNCKAEFQLNI